MFMPNSRALLQKYVVKMIITFITMPVNIFHESLINFVQIA